MRLKLLLTAVLAGSALLAALVPEVRQAMAAGDFAGAERRIAEYRARHGITPEALVAMSWLSRGALARKQYETAEKWAVETRELVRGQLKSRQLDADREMPLALGAAIEVEAQVLAARGERASAVSFLRRELETWRATSIRARIQKNIHLLSLEGKPAPALEMNEWLGSKPAPLRAGRGKPVLLFFWAHWCRDCKAQGPILARLRAEHRDLVMLAPTQRYGYMARGQEADAKSELAYIGEVWRGFYRDLDGLAVPVSEENFRNWGASTTPTLVLIDRAGIVRLYRPGVMSYEELSAAVGRL